MLVQARTRTHVASSASAFVRSSVAVAVCLLTHLDGAFFIADWALFFVGVGRKVLELAALRLFALEAGDGGHDVMGRRHAFVRAGEARLLRREDEGGLAPATGEVLAARSQLLVGEARVQAVRGFPALAHRLAL